MQYAHNDLAKPPKISNSRLSGLNFTLWKKMEIIVDGVVDQKRCGKNGTFRHTTRHVKLGWAGEERSLLPCGICKWLFSAPLAE